MTGLLNYGRMAETHWRQHCPRMVRQLTRQGRLQTALLDARHRVFVNWETYYLSSDENLAKFRADPLKYVGTVTDPVTRERFRPDRKHTRLEHEGRIIWFAKPENAERFRAGPEAYVPPMIGMQGD